METIIWQKADQWLPRKGGVGGMGMRSGLEGEGGMITKGHKENLGVMDIFVILITAMASRVNKYVKTDQIEHFKYVQCIRESIF